MQTREYFHWAHRYLRDRKRIRSVQVKCHQVETSLLEGVLSRGDRRDGGRDRAGLAARRAAGQLDGVHPAAALVGSPGATLGIDVDAAIHQPYAVEPGLPWDHINVKKGRTYPGKRAPAGRGATGRDGGRDVSAECGVRNAE